VNLTNVGYGEAFPVTPEGRLAGGALIIVGITLFAAITGTITSFLVTEQAGDQDGHNITATLRGWRNFATTGSSR